MRLDKRTVRCGMSPMYAYADDGELSLRGEFTLTVATTAVNEIVAKREVMYSYPKAEIGLPYRERLEKFERPSYLKIGSIRIEKLK